MTKHLGNLIGTDTLKGTVVKGEDGVDIGTIDHVVIDARTGKVAYAVVGFGGFLGLGEELHQIPWGTLRVDDTSGDLVTGITRDQLEGAPPPPVGGRRDRQWEERVFGHYGIVPYWF